MKIVIIGAGNVGANLHHAFELKGINAELVHARPLLDVEDPIGGILPQADVYIYTVIDDALAEVAQHVNAPKSLHLHTSGTIPVSIFGEDKPHAGVIYFLQSFSKASLIDDWSGIPCFVDGRNIDDIAAIYSLAQTLTSRIYEANQHDRERLHIAGVFANNYTNLMYRMAAEVLKDTQIPFEALLPLIDQTATKVHTLTPKAAQTGPAARGDGEVVMHHAELLGNVSKGEFFPSDMQFLYLNMARMIQDSNRPETERQSIDDILSRALEASIETTQNHLIPSTRRRRRR